MVDKSEEQRILGGKDYSIKEHEQRNDSLLNWKEKYTIPGSTSYDYHQENMNMTNASHKSKSLLSFANNKLRNSNNNKVENYFEWKNQSISSFRDRSTNNKWKPNPKLCHTATDIGNSVIVIGGMSKQCSNVEILEMKKDFTRIHQLTNLQGHHPCCRWAHSASYIAPLHAIIMIGGFDSTYNWNDIRLLFLSTNNEFGAWYQLETENNMNCKALHSSTVRYLKIINKDKKIQRNLCEVYIFGGQFCDGGPYEYNNDVFRIQFYDKLEPFNNKIRNNKFVSENDEIYGKWKNAFVKTDLVKTCSEDGEFPIERSQHFAFIDNTNNGFYIYGGLNADQEFNDLWCLNLVTKEWKQIKYSIYNILNPPSVQNLNSHNFRLNLSRDKFLYSSKQNKLLIMHCVGNEDTINRSARMIYAIKTHKEIIMNKTKGKMDVDNKEKDNGNDQKEDMISMENQREIVQMTDKLKKLENNIYWIYTLDLNSNVWNILVDNGKNRPSSEITGSVIHRIGDRIWLIGGRDQGSTTRVNRLNNIIGINIPTISISWKQERIIWIGHLKNDDNNKCFLKYLPKEIIGVILLFFKQNVW